MVRNIFILTPSFYIASGRRDDLEQLLYTLVFLAKGDLPWSLKRSYQTEDIIKAKRYS
jgi:hypothetical protein